jgi:hypothetical protein
VQARPGAARCRRAPEAAGAACLAWSAACLAGD